MEAGVPSRGQSLENVDRLNQSLGTNFWTWSISYLYCGMRALDKDILLIAVPSILANITVPLVGIADIAVAGHLDASAAALIGGISIGTMLFDLLYWSFEFLRIGTGGMTAQAYGRGDWKESSGILAKGIAFALAAAVIVLFLQLPFVKLIFLFTECSDEVKELALEYFFVRIWASPATLSLMSVKGWFIGMQDSVSSMFTDLVVNGVNVAASIFLALGVPGIGFGGIGFVGIAWGTVIAQYSGLIFSFAMVFLKHRDVVRDRISFRGLADSIKGGELRRFMTMNADLFIRSLCLIVIYISTTLISARFGDLLLASSSIMMHLLMIFSYFTDGFAFSGEAICGRYYGSGDFVAIDATVKRTFLWSMGVGGMFIAIYAVAGVPLLHMMTSDSAVAETSKQFLPWLVIVPIVGAPAFTWDGIYTGLTATKGMRNSAMGSVAAFYLVWCIGISLLDVSGAMSVHLLLAAYFAHLIYRSAYQTFKYRQIFRQRS